MIVTSVRLRIIRGDKRVKAVGSIVLDRCFQIEYIHVIEKEDGTLVIAMPSKWEKVKGQFQDIAHPITSNFRSEMDRVVLEGYRKASEVLTK
jgi:stage V sporulation protein G